MDEDTIIDAISAEYSRLNDLKARAQTLGENTTERPVRFVCAAITREVAKMQRNMRRELTNG